MKIELKEDPKNRTGFVAGDVIACKGSTNADYRVVGEDDDILHTFSEIGWEYTPIPKADDELRDDLIIVKSGI